MTTALPLLAALLADAALGEPRWLWSRLKHPAVLMGQAVSALERRLNHGSNRRARGVLAVVILSAGALAAGAVLGLAGPVAEALIAAVLLAQRSLVEHVMAVAHGMRRSVDDGRQAVALIVSRDTGEMGGPEVARAAIESGAENLSDGVIAPAMWFLVGGLPGLILYKVVNTADSMIGYRTPRYEDFGWAAARLDDLLNLVPARLTAVLILLASGRGGSWKDITADAARHKSPNAGWPEAAMARALGVALAGPRSYDGRQRDLAWVNGTARRGIGARDIEACTRVLWRVWAISVGVVLGIALL